jgi:hypothetical protein
MDAKVIFTTLIFLHCASSWTAPIDPQRGCNTGDVEIGRQDTGDEIILYCSHVGCDQLGTKLKQDIAAMKKLQRSMLRNNAELEQWTRDNGEAQKAAFNHAVNLLRDSLLGLATDNADLKIKKLKDQLNRRAIAGETITAQLERVRAFRQAYLRLSALSDGLKLGSGPGMNLVDSWAELQEWATKAGKESQALSAAWNSMSTDPELSELVVDAGLGTLVEGVKIMLRPVLQGSFDLTRFLVEYGYDATKWQVTKAQIVARTQLSDENLIAECKLERLIDIDIRNRNVCGGRYSPPDAPDPEKKTCESRR